MRSRSIPATIAALVAMVAMALTTVVTQPTGAGAQTNPYERGPAPTSSSVTQNGTFATSSQSVSSLSVSGFGGGTIYYPTSTSQGTFGAVAVAPGYTASSSAYSWIGPRMASHGFVVFLIDTNSRFDFPPSRGTQLLAALDYLTRSWSGRTRIDATRLAVAGHSMGGGGSLEAASDRTSLQAVVALQPWNTDKTWSEIQSPTMIIGAENDSVASTGSHSIPFYNSIPASSEKAYVELNGASHFVASSPDTWQARSMLVWLKRYVDNDTRYEQFICPTPTNIALSDSRGTCPG
jgi:alpha-beta hydrolase superfamily lysophospholipase